MFIPWKFGCSKCVKMMLCPKRTHLGACVDSLSYGNDNPILTQDMYYPAGYNHWYKTTHNSNQYISVIGWLLSDYPVTIPFLAGRNHGNSQQLVAFKRRTDQQHQMCGTVTTLVATCFNIDSAGRLISHMIYPSKCWVHSITELQFNVEFILKFAVPVCACINVHSDWENDIPLVTWDLIWGAEGDDREEQPVSSGSAYLSACWSHYVPLSLNSALSGQWSSGISGGRCETCVPTSQKQQITSFLSLASFGLRVQIQLLFLVFLEQPLPTLNMTK
jgi:hypothetical protein